MFASKDDFKLVRNDVNSIRDDVELVIQHLVKLEERMLKLEEKVNRIEYNLKVYIDEKMADYTSDIFKRLEKKYQQDRCFKQKIVELLKKHKIGSLEEISFLEGLTV